MSVLFAVIVLCTTIFIVGATGIDANNLAKDILNENIKKFSSESIQSWIDEKLTPGGVGDWYIMSLHQYGDYDYSKYSGKLISYLKQNKTTNVVSKQKFALTLLACNVSEDYLSELVKDDLHNQGVMTYIFALHLCNNGIKLSMTENEIIDTLLSMQNEKGWSVNNAKPDVDVTAMALTSLSVHLDNERVKSAVVKAVEYLSQVQLDDGFYSGFSEVNCETIAQVVIALSSLGIDCENDNRFIKGGNNPLKAMLSFQKERGRYAHSLNGDYNESATYQVLQALIAYLRMKESKTPLFVFDKQESINPVIVEETTEENNETNSTGIQSYKIIAGVAILALGAIAIVIIIIRKAHKKNIIFVVIVAAVLIAIVFLTNISLPSDRGKDIVKNNPIGKITMTIECKVLLGEDSVYIPQSGIILDSMEFEIEEGDTALKVLREASSKYNFKLDVKNGYYVLGINNLYEKEYGDLSGWMYYINGVSASVGANEYVLKDGDFVEWRYTKNIGKDLE